MGGLGWIQELPEVNCEKKTKKELLTTLKIELHDLLKVYEAEAEVWDKQFEEDVKAGKLDRFAGGGTCRFSGRQMRRYIRHVKTRHFREHYQELPRHVQQLADKNFELLKQNSRHPSLALKKVRTYWSARVGP